MAGKKLQYKAREDHIYGRLSLGDGPQAGSD